MNYLIGVDVGTSATKTVLFDEDGAVAASASREYPLYQPENGWAEQRPEDWRDAVLATLKAVTEQSGVPAEDIKGIGISGQMHGLVMLDGEGEVIRPSIIWCDQRTGREVEDMLEIMPRERWIEITANPPLTGWTAAKILWVRKHEPENYSRCRHILLPKDYIRYVLTGEFATEVSDASGMQLLDVPKALLAKKLEVAAGHEAALAGHRLDEALRFQLGVGALRRDDADAQIAGQRPDGGQLLPFAQLTRQDEGLHLRDDLVVDGLVARIRDDDVQLRLPFVVSCASAGASPCARVARRGVPLRAGRGQARSSSPPAGHRPLRNV